LIKQGYLEYLEMLFQMFALGLPGLLFLALLA
jgi:hypothetical protein